MANVAVYSGYPRTGIEKTDFAAYRSAMGYNSGNLIFKVGSLFSTCRASDQVRYTTLSKEDIEELNSDYDYVLFAGANLINPTLDPRRFQDLAEGINRLRIPFVTLSVGAQASIDYDASLHRRLAPALQRFLQVLADKTPILGVRGNYTAEILNKLGITNLAPVGCPSMFSRGITPACYNYVPTTRSVACNIAPAKRLGPRCFAHKILREAAANDHFVVEQTLPLAAKLLHFPKAVTARDHSDFSHIIDKLFRQSRLRFFSSYATWLSFLSERTFSFGMRIHGNIAAALAGTACHIVYHDSRVREIAELFELPRSDFRKLLHNEGGLSLAGYLCERTDMRVFQSLFLKRLLFFRDFLDANGVNHNLDSDGALLTDHEGDLSADQSELSWSSERAVDLTRASSDIAGVLDHAGNWASAFAVRGLCGVHAIQTALHSRRSRNHSKGQV